jgi:hypothetical protein
VVTYIQSRKSNTSPKQRFLFDVKLDYDGRVTVWDKKALSQVNCQLIKGRLLGSRGDLVASNRQR